MSRWQQPLVAFGLALFLSVQMVCDVSALAVPAKPTLETPIIDQTDTLSAAQIQQLAAQIAASRQEKSYQIGILMIPTLGTDEYLEGYSLKVARSWGIGEQGKDNGVLILVVKQDHVMRIEVGRGVEGDLTDARASRIIRDVMTPAFRKNDFAGGLSGAIDSIQKAVSQQADPSLQSAAVTNHSNDILSILAPASFFIIGGLSWVASMLARSKSWWAGGVIGGVAGVLLIPFVGFVWWSVGSIVALTLLGLLLDYFISRDYKQHLDSGSLPSWWAGGGSIGGGWSGGGGGSFGGGGFSGGGSSGDW